MKAMINKIEVNLNAIVNNLNVVKKQLDPECKIIGVVKANAYGHGLIETARSAWTAGADILATASLDEAVALRVAKIKAPIIVLSYVEPVEFRRVLDFDITLTIFDYQTAVKLDREAAKQNKWAKVDIKVDTGMNRYGFAPYEALDNYKKIMALDHIKITGIHSHFAEPENREFTKNQINIFQNVLFGFQQNRISPPMVHISATKGILLFPESHFDAVRIGLALYGYCGNVFPESGLIPALELKSHIAQIRRVGPGETISYDRTFKAKSPMKVAVIPIGYADGYPRALTNKGELLVNSKRARVVGRVCMNIFMADVTGISCSAGDEVILIGSEGDDKVDAEDLANWGETIPNEILSRLSPTIPREYHFK